MDKLRLTKSLLCSLALLVLGFNTELVLATDYGSENNFTMLIGGNAFSPGGGRVGGTNDVSVIWDGTLNTDVATAVVNMTISSPTPFFGQPWFAHDVMVYGPGTYTFETCLPDGSTFGVGTVCDGSQSRELTMTVDVGQIGAHMLFDWGSAVNIDVLNVWDLNSVWQGAPDSGDTGFNASWLEIYDVCGWTYSDGIPLPPAECDPWVNNNWYLTSTDDDGDGEFGIGMKDGPFNNYNANFNIRLGVLVTGNDAVFTVVNNSVITSDVLTNDVLPGNRSTYSITAFDLMTAQGGSVTDNGDNTFTYLPPVNFMGIDSFSYTVSDGILTSVGKVEVVVLSEEAAAVLLPQLKGATTTSSSTTSGESESGGVGATGLLAIPLMLLLLPLRLFARKK